MWLFHKPELEKSKFNAFICMAKAMGIECVDSISPSITPVKAPQFCMGTKSFIHHISTLHPNSVQLINLKNSKVLKLMVGANNLLNPIVGRCKSGDIPWGGDGKTKGLWIAPKMANPGSRSPLRNSLTLIVITTKILRFSIPVLRKLKPSIDFLW